MRAMQRRLLKFFSAVRTESPQLQWTFVLITCDAQTWTESMLAAKGMPSSWVTMISADVSCPFTGKLVSGFFTTQRTVRLRKAARNLLSESKPLVADVLAEFAKRFPDFL